ncbi:hypothetical protein Thpro_022952 [Acidihalobacter prosperus]|uniref:Uncharacterized protein n=1 Tax=Acidihalobacter prosperus TaxID=160660 RepID=A0A1A6C2A7_9GAMM|nr:hypothetical protein Thpro_022952 [Acidihalobacter prosperus]
MGFPHRIVEKRVFVCIPAMYLHDHAPTKDKLLVFVDAVPVSEAKHGLIPDAGHANVSDGNQRLWDHGALLLWRG